jgi:hypothetical protein
MRRNFFLIRIRDTTSTPAAEKFLIMLCARCANNFRKKNRAMAANDQKQTSRLLFERNRSQAELTKVD